MEEKSTSKLMEILKHTKKTELAALQDDLTVQSHSFITYMDRLIEQRNLKRQDIFQKADMPQKYGYKLLNGESHTKDRDKLLRIFIAMGMNLKEVQRALALYGMPGLYPKNGEMLFSSLLLMRGFPLWIRSIAGCGNMEKQN